LDDALDRLVFAAQRRDEDAVETARETIGLAFRRLVREIADLHELLDHQPKKEVVH
jgi:Arc/MetJ family transcription regulator